MTLGDGALMTAKTPTKDGSVGLTTAKVLYWTRFVGPPAVSVTTPPARTMLVMPMSSAEAAMRSIRMAVGGVAW